MVVHNVMASVQLAPVLQIVNARLVTLEVTSLMEILVYQNVLKECLKKPNPEPANPASKDAPTAKPPPPTASNAQEASNSLTKSAQPAQSKTANTVRTTGALTALETSS